MTTNLQPLFTYTNVNECENTLNLAYAIREVLCSASFQEDNRVRASLVLKSLNSEIKAAEKYWTTHGGGNQ